MKSNLPNNVELGHPDPHQDFEIDWVEYGVERVLNSQGRSRISEPVLLNTSLYLSDEQVKLYQPFDPLRGIAVNHNLLWQSWPSFFRGCLFLRKIGESILLCSFRGELEYPDIPLASRYYTYGIWLSLPSEWFAPIAVPDLATEVLLADRLYSVIWAAMTRRPSDQVLPSPQPLRIEQRAFPYATLMPSLARTAEVMAASRQPKTYVVEAPSVLEAAEASGAAEALETAAALLCHMAIAVWRTNSFESIVRRGIALYPPPPPSEQRRFAWIVPWGEARTEVTVATDPSARSEPQYHPAERLTIDATVMDPGEAEKASLFSHNIAAIVDSGDDGAERRRVSRHDKFVRYATISLMAFVIAGTIGSINYSILHINDKPREVCEDFLRRINIYAGLIPKEITTAEQERCRSMIWYRTVRLPYCLRDIAPTATPWRTNHELGLRISGDCQDILRCETIDNELWNEAISGSNAQIVDMNKKIKMDSQIAEICHWEPLQIIDMNGSQ